MTSLRTGIPHRSADPALLATLGPLQQQPIEYHVYRGTDGQYLVARQAQTMGRYYSETSARELACWCAVMDAVRGQPARVHVQVGGEWLVAFETTDHAADDMP